MNKSRKTSNLYNVVTYDETGNIVVPAGLTLGTAPASSDNSSKAASTAWIRTYLAGQSYATTASVDAAISAFVDAAPTTLDTLNELAAALGDDPTFATTVTASIGTKVPQARTITINGTAYDLSADRTWTIAAGLTSFNTRTGAITLTSGDVTTALGFTPYNSTNPSGYITGITSSMVTTALGFTPYNSTNPSGYITGITSGMVTTALGYTPYNSSNPSGYITTARDWFGAMSTGGTADWNHVSNTRPGTGYSLLLGNGTNGPGPSIYMHPFNLEYSSKDGTGNVTQMAIAYGTPGNELYMRGRYDGSWVSWVRFWNSSNFNPSLYYTGSESDTRYINTSGDTMTGKLQINADWGGTNPERFTIRGTYPSITLRSTNYDSNWLIHNDSSLTFYYAAGVDSDSWGVRMRLETDGTLKLNGNIVIHAGTIGSQSVSYASSAGAVGWANISGGIRDNYTLEFKPTADNYAGFKFTGTNGVGSGYLLIRGSSDSDIYTANGITLVADQGWLTLAQRTSSTGGIRFSTGTTAIPRMEISNNGVVRIDNNIVIHVGNYTSYLDPRYVRRDTTSQFLKPYLEYSSYLGNDAPSTLASQMSGGGMRVDFMGSGGSADGSWSHVITFSGYNRYSMSQIGTNYNTTNARLYYRQTNNHDDAWASWKQFAFHGQDVTFAGVTASNITASSDIRGNDVYTTGGWFRNHTNNNGIYWSSTGWHIYPEGASDMNWRSGGPSSAVKMMTSGAITRGYFYANDSNQIGILTNDGNWGLRVNSNKEVNIHGNLVVGYGQTSSNIWMADTDETQRRIHCNSNRIGFLNSSDGWGSYCNNDGSWVSTSDITAYSDARIKENIETVDNALEKVSRLRGVYYNRTDLDDKSRKLGVIAQETQVVVPEVVHEELNGMLGVSYGNLGGLFIEAFKEQQSQIESQQSEIAELKDLVKQLLAK